MALQSCKRCREKHIKCKNGPGPWACLSCSRASVSCLPSSPQSSVFARLRLKPVRSVTEQSRRSSHRREVISFTYRRDHTWVDFATPVRFPDAGQTQDSSDLSSDTNINNDRPQLNDGRRLPEPQETTIASTGESSSPPTVPGLALDHSSASLVSATTSPPGHTPVNPRTRPDPSPYTLAIPSVPRHDTPTTSFAAHTPLTSPYPLWPLRNRDQADLLRHFIAHIGPELDVTDDLCHFTVHVPQRAMHCPLLLYAVIAVASIHRSRVYGVADDISPDFQARCVRILIGLLNDPDYVPDEQFLAAIVILRKGEEMSEDDKMCHLLGSSRVINSFSAVAALGGLGEAAAWMVLRQSVYVSLTNNTPLDIDLDCYRGSRSFLGLSDHAWANKIVFLFAKILVLSTGSGRSAGEMTPDQWQPLMEDVEAWMRDKPDTFVPLYESEPEGTDRPGPRINAPLSTAPLGGSHRPTSPLSYRTRQPFPEIAMLQAPHVDGLMYYHLSLIMLALTHPGGKDSGGTAPRRPAGLPGLRWWCETEDRIRRNLRRCMGLAMSNPHVAPANFEASHILFVCGHCLSNEDERRAALEFLRGVRLKLGWETQHIIRHLESRWSR